MIWVRDMLFIFFIVLPLALPFSSSFFLPFLSILFVFTLPFASILPYLALLLTNNSFLCKDWVWQVSAKLSRRNLCAWTKYIVVETGKLSIIILHIEGKIICKRKKGRIVYLNQKLERKLRSTIYIPAWKNGFKFCTNVTIKQGCIFTWKKTPPSFNFFKWSDVCVWAVPRFKTKKFPNFG